jgi:hypothetical protein
VSNPFKTPRSLKTLLVYVFLVIFLILISFAVKAFFVFQKSLYDGKHHLAIAAVERGSVKEIVAFNPEAKTLSVLELTGDRLSPASLDQTFGFIPDATIQLDENFPVGKDVSQTLYASIIHFPTLHTDLTLFDVIRLYLFSRDVSEENKIVKEIRLPRQESDIDKIVSSFFGDETLTFENVSIHVINASSVSGMGKRLERVLNNLGCNVISVSTANTPVAKSTIQYRGEKVSYTVTKLKRLLGFPVSMSSSQARADIVITVGEDSPKAESF